MKATEGHSRLCYSSFIDRRDSDSEGSAICYMRSRPMSDPIYHLITGTGTTRVVGGHLSYKAPLPGAVESTGFVTSEGGPEQLPIE